MSLTFGFYNSKNHDRLYDAVQVSSMFDGIIEDGVYANIGDRFKVSYRSGMTATVGLGRAWFNHTWTVNDAPLIVNFEASDQVLNRIDGVFLEIDTRDEYRENRIVVKKGVPGSTPAKPVPDFQEGVYRYPLAYVTIDKGVTTLEPSKIENTVGTSACPFVTGVLETMNIDDLLTQWTDEADELIEELRVRAEQATAGILPNGSVSEDKLTSTAVRLRWTNVNVAANIWRDNNTYSSLGYTKRAQVTPSSSIADSGGPSPSLIKSTMQPDVIFSPDALALGVLAPFADTIDGSVYIYAMSAPTSTITISTLTCWR